MGMPASELMQRMSAVEFSEHIVDQLMEHKEQKKAMERQQNQMKTRRR